MKDKIYATSWILQKPEIEAHCFGKCKKVIFAMLDDETLGPLSHCRESECPYLDKQIEDPFGDVDGADVYLRKLISVEAAKTEEK